jgi:hypothetical protein
MRVAFENTIAYTPRELARAFAPACGERAIRRAIKAGTLKTYKIGSRNYITRDAAIRALEEGNLK